MTNLTLSSLSRPHSLFDRVDGRPMDIYRRIFGVIILLELLFMTDTIIHVVYEKWEPCFVPIFRDLGIPVTHFYVDSAIYAGMFFAILFICDTALPSLLNTVVDIGLFLAYTYVRCVHFYNWNNHYYLNMIMLFLFVFIPGNTGTRVRWQHTVIQFFFGSVYFFAGVSKISSAWLDGVIAETMTFNHDLILPNLILSWGGFLLDLLGGLLIMVNCVYPVPTKIAIFTHVSFMGFHLHNLMYMFKSIQFFPLHMLFTPLVFITRPMGKTDTKQANIGIRRFTPGFVIVWTVVILQAIFATRRFFILVDSPLAIMKANDIAEFHSQVHHFSWRMKSRTCSSAVHVSGRWPVMMAVGISGTHTEPENVTYIPYTKVYYNKIYADAEFGIQPLVNRVRRQMPTADPAEVKVNLFWWGEVNHQPYQLIVNPELNFVGASHLPMIAAPPLSHVEAQVEPRPDFKTLIEQAARVAGLRELGIAPFVTRSIPGVWVPNPLISAADHDLMPKAIVCLYGDIAIRENGVERVCDRDFHVLPQEGQFHLQFKSESMFLLAFKQ